MSKKNEIPFTDNFKDLEPDPNIEIKHTSLNIDLIRVNVPQYSSKKICEMIVCNRYFEMNKEISVICMEELGKRRANGDDFNFEDYIEKSYKELPTLNFEIPDLREILKQSIKK